MRKLLKAALALILICVLLALAGCENGLLLSRRAAYLPTPTVTAQPEKTPGGDASTLPARTPQRSPQPVEQLIYEAPDLDALAAALEGLEADITTGEPAELVERYAAVLALYNAADSAAQTAYLLYARDVTVDTYWEEYARIDEALLALDLTMTDLSVALFDSSGEAEQLARARFGDGYVDAVYAEEELSSEEVIDLFVADNELQFAYDQLLTTFSFMDNGKRWTLDDILNDGTLGYDTYIDLYERYCEELNQEAGALFLDLLALRAEIAAKLGFGSYAAYRYACYDRDYTVMDAQAFHAAVKEYMVPVFIDANERTSDVYDLYYASYGQEKFMDSLAEAISGDRLAAEALRFMRANGLCDSAVSAAKMEGSFTIYLSALETPYIFTEWESDSYSIGTMLHEFGHFMNYYYNPAAGWSSGDSLDLAEIDSQGFVLLMSPHYDALYGPQYGRLAETDQLLDALYAIVTGSMEDEFQQKIYSDPGMTLEEMNALYKQLAVAYGMDVVYGFTGTEWTLISHTFQSPMYYISYATSMMAALELWQLEQESGRDAAWDAYWRILMREPYAEFRDTLLQNRMGDPLSRSTVKRLSELLNRSIP